MKIAFCTPGSADHEDYRAGNLLGTEFQVFGLAQELVKQGNQVYIFRRWYDRTKEDEINGTRIINISSPDLPDRRVHKVFSKLLFSRRVAREVKAIAPDMIVLTEISSAYFPAKLEIKKIYVTHNPPSDLFNVANPAAKYFKRRLEKRVFGSSDAIVALNSTTKEGLAKLGYNVVLIPNGIDVKTYHSSNVHGNYVLFGGRFDKIKGLRTLIEAYSCLSTELKNQFKLVLVGEGPEKEALERLSNTLGIGGYVEFVPWQHTLQFKETLSRSAVYALPSLFEGFPVVMLEAMACSKPIISSDTFVSRDVIVSGHNGFIFQKENVNDLSETMGLVLSDENLRKRVGANARATIEDKYTFEKIARDYLQLFSSLLDS
jgi:glycosyltransferase involved in cell wall biosynthesis